VSDLKLKHAQHAYEVGHRVIWDEARILEMESNSRYKKYKELVHMTTQSGCLSHLDPISDEVIKSKRSLRHTRFPVDSYV
jgi:hypothetical protein